MKVLFSNPPWWEEPMKFKDSKNRMHTIYRAGIRAGSRWPFTVHLLGSKPDKRADGEYVPYPFFMGYAATYLQKHAGVDVLFRDSIALRESYRTWVRYLKTEKPDYIVIESASSSWEHDKKLLFKINQHFPKMKIIITGPISAKAKEVLETTPAIACVKGEYEKGVLQVIEGTEGILPHNLLTKKEMNAAPFPWFDELHAYKYWDDNPKGQRAPQAQVWSSRGCPYKCIFCVWPATMTGNDPDGTGRRKVRHYSKDYMEGFLTELVERFSFRTIYFDDDTFNKICLYKNFIVNNGKKSY